MLVEIEQELQDQEEAGLAGGIPGEVGATISGSLFAYVRPKRLGRVFNAQTDFEIPGLSGKKQPDVAFVKWEKLPKNTFDAVPVVPDLAVEVASKSDYLYNTEDKAFEYIAAGVRLVWVVRPKHKLVEVYHPGDLKPTLLDVNDELDGEDIIPGFKLKVSDIFD